MAESDVPQTSTRDHDDPLSSFQAYIRHCVFMAGNNAALAKVLDFSTGSRIGDWLNGDGRPNPLAALKLAEFSGHDILIVLRLCGHEEMAGIIERGVAMRRGVPQVYKQRLDEAIAPVEQWLRELQQYKEKL